MRPAHRTRARMRSQPRQGRQVAGGTIAALTPVLTTGVSSTAAAARAPGAPSIASGPGDGGGDNCKHRPQGDKGKDRCRRGPTGPTGPPRPSG
ncbi:hypothetical protein GCM10018966_094600 [Streptomyces yanii]